MAIGAVEFFNDTVGYAFIDTEDTDADGFFHTGDVGGPDLEERQGVGFDIVRTDTGPRARSLHRL